MDQLIRVRGTKDDVLKLKNELETRFEDTVKISEPSPDITKLNTRQAYRQNELFDILISIAVNLVSTAVYEQCKMLIEDFQKKRKVEVHFENNSIQSETKEEKSQQSPVNHPDEL